MQAKPLSQRKATRIYFQHEDSDYYFMQALAYQSEHGSQFGECFYIALQIEEGKAESWMRAWSSYADRLAREAGAREKGGHVISAQECYLRASTYYRTSTIFLRVGDPRWRETWQRHRYCFQRASALMARPLEVVAVRMEDGIILPGYFMPGGGAGEKLPTVIYVSGGESLAEDAYFWCGAAGMRRGYNVVAVELPVHMGARLRNPNLSATGRTSETITVSLRAIVDYALSRSDVDPRRLAILGYSAGGTFAAHAAAMDTRIKACIADSPIRDQEKLFSEEFPRALLRAPSFVGNFALKLAAGRDELAAIVLERICWQVGADSAQALVKRAGEIKIAPEAIKCPMLCLASAGEGRGYLEQAVEVYEALTVPKRLRIFSLEEGAEAHCQLNNLARAQAVIFDWLDDTLKVEDYASTRGAGVT